MHFTALFFTGVPALLFMVIQIIMVLPFFFLYRLCERLIPFGIVTDISLTFPGFSATTTQQSDQKMLPYTPARHTMVAPAAQVGFLRPVFVFMVIQIMLPLCSSYHLRGSSINMVPPTHSADHKLLLYTPAHDATATAVREPSLKPCGNASPLQVGFLGWLWIPKARTML